MTMPDDDKPATDDPGTDPAPASEGSAAEELLTSGPRRRRRPPRSWSTTGSGERFDRPITDSSWGWQASTAEPPRGATAAVPPPPPPPPPPPTPDLPPRPIAPIGPALAPNPPPAAPADPPLVALLGELREEFGQLRDALTAARSAERPTNEDGTIVSGAELATVIENLGVSLGNGMATLLSDHRALLARDIEAGSDRVLEDVGRRLRTTANQVIDGVEAKVRHVTAQSQAGLADQLDSKLDQLQADIVGLRAVVLEIPDQTEVTARLDNIADGLAELNAEHARDLVSSRVSPGLMSALEETLAAPMERIEETVTGATQQLMESVEAQRLANIGEIDGERIAPDSEGMAKLTKEVVALRRRIGLRAEAPVELTDAQLDAIAERVVAKLQAKAPATVQAKPAARPAAKTPAKTSTKAATPRKATTRKAR
jgi:hypothetical protein